MLQMHSSTLAARHIMSNSLRFLQVLQKQQDPEQAAGPQQLMLGSSVAPSFKHSSIGVPRLGSCGCTAASAALQTSPMLMLPLPLPPLLLLPLTADHQRAF
jgi:hypothetical protein